MTRFSWVLAAILCLVGNRETQARQFRAAEYFPAGTNPYQVLRATFTNSGNIDLAIANFPGNSVSVLLGNGDGTFQKPRALSVPAPVWIASGDLDHDGLADLVILESGGTGKGTLSVYLSNGDGSFRRVGNYTAGFESISLALADFDGDGNLDIAVANSNQSSKSGNVMLFFGDGTGKFGKPTTYAVSSTPWSIEARDLNGDHRPDLAVTQETAGSVAVLLNDGTGHFSKPVSYNAGGGEVVDVKIADLRHDGRNDLLAANLSKNELAVLLNKGDGTFEKAAFYVTGFSWGSGTEALVVADFNLNGHLDVAAVNKLGASALLYGHGDGTFDAAVEVFDKIHADGGFSLAVGDFNHDNAPDLAIPIQNYGKVAILLNTQ